MSEWVLTSERLPTIDDASYDEFVWTWDGVDVRETHCDDVCVEYVKAWMPRHAPAPPGVMGNLEAEIDRLRGIYDYVACELHKSEMRAAELEGALGALYDRFDPVAMLDLDESARVAGQARRALGRK